LGVVLVEALFVDGEADGGVLQRSWSLKHDQVTREDQGFLLPRIPYDCEGG
jgi:hypothetical protein